MTAPDVVADLLADAGMTGDPELTAVLTDLRDLASGPAPEPSPALAALLAGDPVMDTAVLTALPVARERRRRRAAAGVSALVLAAVASTGVAAAANQLPAGAQRLAVRFSQQFLPFSFPPPREDGPLTPGSPAPHGAGEPDPAGDGATGAGEGTPGVHAPGTTSAPGALDRHGDGRAGHRSGSPRGGHHDDGGWTTTRRDRDATGSRPGDDDPRSAGDGSADRARPGADGPGGDGSHRGSGSTGSDGSSTGDGGSDGSSTGDGGPDGSGTGSGTDGGGTSDDGGSDGGTSGGTGDGADSGARVPDVTGALPQ